MKTLTKYLNEKLIINKDYKSPYTCAPTSCNELREIIDDRYNKFGPGTKDTPVDFNDIDISNIDSFYNEDNNKGIFEETKFNYIDISYWDVSNIKNMRYIFHGCTQLKSIGDLSEWDVSNCENTNSMFFICEQLKSVGDLSNWDISNVKNMGFMFHGCIDLTSVGDLSNWNVSKVTYMSYMFYGCTRLKSVGDLSKWNVSNVKFMNNAFKESGITNIPKWYKR